MLYLFVDEAGIPGSTENFVIGFAFFPNEDYKRCVDIIRSKVKTKNGKPPRELHFHDISSRELKREFLELLVKSGGKFGYIHVRKEMIYQEFRIHPDNNLIYNLMLSYLIENLVNRGYNRQSIQVFIDQRSANRMIKRDLAKYLPKKIDPIIAPQRLYVRWARSHNSHGIQCADFICGSVYRKITKNDFQYYEIIKPSVIVARNNLFEK